jgi:hypothetical protein
MALTIPSQIFGMMASALNNSKQPEIIKWFCRLPVAMQDKTIKLNKMKKIFTMCLGLVLTAAVFAADRKPDVTIISMKKYEIVVDGRTYYSNNRMLNIDNLRNGRHTIQVYDMSSNRGFSIFQRKRLVASKSFQLKNNDVKITISQFGQLTITEDRFGRNDRYGNDNRGWDDHDGRDQQNDHSGRNSRDRNF